LSRPRPASHKGDLSIAVWALRALPSLRCALAIFFESPLASA